MAGLRVVGPGAASLIGKLATGRGSSDVRIQSNHLHLGERCLSEPLAPDRPLAHIFSVVSDSHEP